MKYEKPKLVELSKLNATLGACEDGYTNIEICGPGGTVIPLCAEGGAPTTRCDNGGSF